MRPPVLVLMVTGCALFGLALAVGLASPPGPAGPPPKANEGETCGTIRGIACADGLWCDLRPGTCRGADLDGVCVKVPEVCTQEYIPVCACDGKTYGNECTRRAARAQKDHDGECTPSRKSA